MIETLPPVILGATLTTFFVAAWALRRPLESFFVFSVSASAQPRRQFLLDMSLCTGTGVAVAIFNSLFFGFPFIASGFKLILGFIVLGFFISLDMALARERTVITESLEQETEVEPPGRLYSMTRKFALVAVTSALFVAVIIIVVISRDFAWLAGIEPNPTSLAQAQVLFIMAVLLGLVVNLIFSYSRNLKLLFENETDILERVSRGDLSRRVPVATNDEFGVIAGHTNTMIRGLKHRIKLLSALKMAEELQQNLLPQHPPAHPGLDVAGMIIYCYEIGGDYYDYLNLPDGRMGIVVADAADHGIGAALYMTTARAFLLFGIHDYHGPGLLIDEVNRYLTRDSSDTGRFITLFFLEIDSSTQTLRWVRAGHDPGTLYDPIEDNFIELDGEGLALGVIEEFSFQEYTRQGWTPGSVVFIGTDGIRDTRNKGQEMYGLKRLHKVIRHHAAEPAEIIRNRIIESVRNFQGDVPQEDDITLVVIKLL
ncbi:MAG: SpoIIE family protein phosphatase [Deltaproteobacteria bacterium]|nr:SpoIIE family protein phosphatase [Deltaproteobacteria bacterium]